MSIKKFKCPLYGFKFHFFLGLTEDEVNQYLRERKSDEIELDGCFGTCWQDKDHIFIWLKEEPKKKTLVARLHHEVGHATNYVAKARGIKLCPDNDEALAYLSQWIFEKCIKLIL